MLTSGMCLYCGEPMGTNHKPGCVLINKKVNESIGKIYQEHIVYRGFINFASKGITGDPEMLVRAFRFGFDIGVECTKKDVIKIILDVLSEASISSDA